jgi:PAS domain S-box-containing protein
MYCRTGVHQIQLVSPLQNAINSSNADRGEVGRALQVFSCRMKRRSGCNPVNPDARCPYGAKTMDQSGTRLGEPRPEVQPTEEIASLRCRMAELEFLLKASSCERDIALRALQESNRRIEVALKNSNFIPSQFGLDLRYSWICNHHPDFDPLQVIGRRDDELDDSEGVRHLIALKQRVVEEGVGVQEEVSFQRSDGLRTYDMIIEPLTDQEGTVIGGACSAFDITERKRAEETLREREGLLSAMFDQAGLGITLLELDGQFTRVNAVYCAALGYDEAKLRTLSVWDLTHPEDLPEFRRRVDQLRKAAAASFSMEKRERKRDGSYAWARVTVSLVREPGGAARHLLSLFEDNSERKAAEEQLQASEAKYRRLVETANEGIWVIDHQNRTSFVNAKMAEMLGCTIEEMSGGSLFDFIDLEAELLAHHYIHKRRQGVTDQHDFQFRRRDGSIFWALVSTNPIHDDQGNYLGALGMITDITQRKQVEQELKATLAKTEEGDRMLAALMESVPEGITLCDATGKVRMVSQHGKELLGAALVGQSLSQVVEQWTSYRPDGRTVVPMQELPLVRALQGETVRNVELLQETCSGHKLPLLCNAAPLCDAAGQVAGAILVWRDISDLKRVGQALRDSERRFRTLADSMPQLVWTADPDGHVDYYNLRHKELQGIERLPDGTYQWSPVLHPEDQGRTVEAWQAAMRTGKQYQIEHRVQLRDGCYRWYLSRGLPVHDDDGRIVKWFGTATDIEIVKRAEVQLRQLNETLEREVAERTELAEARSRQLQALAIELIETEERERRQFAYLLHDDLQQMLAAAKMHVQAVLGTQDHPLLSSAAKLLEESIGKSRRLSHELSPAVLHQSGLATALEWLMGQLHEQFGLEVEFRAETHEPLGSNPVGVFLFRAARELLFNIVKHSGVLQARMTISSSSDLVTLTVNDSGCGFDLHSLDSSTANTGFGLLSIRERANYIGGRLTIDSAPGKGSSLTLVVPFQSPSPAAETILGPPTEPSLANLFLRPATGAAGDLQVLFVDDHKVMRQGLIRLVTGQPNIKVVGEAANGMEALSLARQLRPDVVIMDISMPGMDGIECTRRIKAVLPEVRVIGLSMHDDERITREMLDAGADASLSKTVSAAELIEVIHRVAAKNKVHHPPRKNPTGTELG